MELFLSCVCVARFKKYGRTRQIVLLVHQQEAMTQNKRTHLYWSCNRKRRKTVTDWSIVKSFVSSVGVFSRNCVAITGRTDASQFDRNETHGLNLNFFRLKKLFLNAVSHTAWLIFILQTKSNLRLPGNIRLCRYQDETSFKSWTMTI